jgi:hypothetical protein
VAEYQELRVRFERIGEAEAGYRLFVSGPAGEAAGVFRLPYADIEIENLVLKLSRPRSAVRRIDSPELDLVRAFGSGLFDALFSGRVRDVYRSSLASARGEGCGMRISLALTGTPELMHIPWEFLYDDPAFLSISTWTPVVRYLDLATTRRPLKVEPPLRILAMVSSPSDVVQLDVEQERAKLEESLAELTERGGVQIRWLEEATLQSLQRELRRDDYHVFHYIGHGGYDRASDDGMLVLEDGSGRSRFVSGMELGTILADETTLRLVVLNACEGARSSVSDPFSGVATSLVHREIPAVVAMQLEITDRAAITFAGEFYAALADGYAVDAALAEARKAIFADRNEVEWATPVLFMRVPDGRIFDVAQPIGGHEPQPDPVRAVDEREVEPLADATAVARAAQETPTPPAGDETTLAPAAAGSPTEVVPARLRGRVRVTLSACTLLLALGVVYPWDHHRGGRSWLQPFFGPLSNTKGGFFTSLSPIAVVIVAAIGTALAARGRRLQLAAGLLVACGLAASAKYLGVLGRVIESSPVRVDSVPVFSLVLAASSTLIVVGIQIAQLTGTRLGREGGKQRVMAALLGASAFLILVGCLVPFNGGGPAAPGNRSIVPDEGPQLLDPLVVGLALLAVSLCLRYLPRRLAAGVALALSVESLALWVRYIGVPIVESDTIASLRYGAILGLAGAALTLTVGLRLLLTAPERAPAQAPTT